MSWRKNFEKKKKSWGVYEKKTGLTSIPNHHRHRYIILLVLLGIAISGLAISGTDDIFIVAGGDVMLGSWAEEVIQRNGWDYPFKNLDSVLYDADVVFANLEAPFGDADSAFDKTYTFQVSPDLVHVLTAGKLNIVSLANNHILDFGIENLQETINLLKQHNIKFSGAGLNLIEARRPAIFEIKGKRLALASYSLTFPEEFWATDSTAGTCFPYHHFVFDDIRKFKRENDFLIVSCHWGGELLKYPKDYQMEIAHKVIDAGADLILGHHPHIVQGIEMYKGKIIAYSLGNYVFGSFSESVRKSMLLKFKYGMNGIEHCRIFPISVYNKEIEFQPRLLSGIEKQDFIIELKQISQELNGQNVVISDAGWVNL
jgi:poly-gamma-glutamate synthesis protein (capsule biosynthesis protein)